MLNNYYLYGKTNTKLVVKHTRSNKILTIGQFIHVIETELSVKGVDINVVKTKNLCNRGSIFFKLKAILF